MGVIDSSSQEFSAEHNGRPDVYRKRAYQLLADSVAANKCILFLGAGVHYPPPEASPYSYAQDTRPPLGHELASELAKQCDFSSKCPNEAPTNLMRVSLCYERETTRADLVGAVRQAVHGAAPSAAVRGLAALPFSLIITTNYDTLFEQALRDAGKEPVVGVYDASGEEPTMDYPVTSDLSPQTPFVFKVHGDFNSPRSMVITDEDYIQFVLRMGAPDRFHPVPGTFRYHFARWPTLFVGYSLLDYNLRLLFRTLWWKVDAAQHPASYSVDLSPDVLIREVWQTHGFRFIAEDVWDFVPNLYQDVLKGRMPA